MSRAVQGTTIVVIDGGEPHDGPPLFESVDSLLGERRSDVILDIRGVADPSPRFLGSLWRIITSLDGPVPIIVASPMKSVFQILPPVGGLPWRIFESEAEALNYIHERHR